MHKVAPLYSLISGIGNLAVFAWTIISLVYRGLLSVQLKGEDIYIRCDTSVYSELAEDISTDVKGSIHSNSKYFMVTSPLPSDMSPTEYGEYLAKQAEILNTMSAQTHHDPIECECECKG